MYLLTVSLSILCIVLLILAAISITLGIIECITNKNENYGYRARKKYYERCNC